MISYPNLEGSTKEMSLFLSDLHSYDILSRRGIYTVKFCWAPSNCQVMSPYAAVQLYSYISGEWFEWLKQPNGHRGICLIFLQLRCVLTSLSLYLLLGRGTECPLGIPQYLQNALGMEYKDP